jgi:hypothetical protein
MPGRVRAEVRRHWIAAAAVVGCLLVVAIALAWRAHDQSRRHEVEAQARTVATQLAVTTRRVERTTTQADRAQTVIAKTTEARDALTTLLGALQTELARVSAERDSTAVGAVLTGVRAGIVQQCLQGVQQALNQLSVGDRGGITSLQRVAGPCREATT